ncbi:MAG: hypothetical protein IT445_01165 [Phycisphaeraceae bacterium]|nr:hypothetical protein [Phycisphaeraceae bacterium]
MPRFFHPLIMMLASATHRELVAEIQYLQSGIDFLRSKLPKRVTLTERERHNWE